MRIAVVMFPGASGAADVVHAYGTILKQDAYIVSCHEEELGQPDVLIIPGGFSFGDYLRPGALAKATNIAGPIRKFAKDGAPVLGIGNGFQILCELGVLPGGFVQNAGARFVNKWVHVMVESTKSPFTKNIQQFRTLRLPLACGFGAYFADKRTMRDLENSGLVSFRYCNDAGEADPEANVTGSLGDIVGIISRHENVLGLMVHPERAVEESMGGTDGLEILRSVLTA